MRTRWIGTAARRRGTIALALMLMGLAWAASAQAVDQPSTYPGCATRQVSVPWGGAVKVDLADCHSFGLGVLATSPTHGTATPGDSAPVDSYLYTHKGVTPEQGGGDRFVVLDDNSDTITVQVSIAPRTAALATTPGTLAPLVAGAPTQQTLATTGGSAPYTYALGSGALPPGLALAPSGLLSGTPSQRGPYAFSVAVKDAAGASARQSYAGSVDPPVLSISPARATASPGAPFSLALAITGGVAPHRVQLEAGPGLPAGLAVSSAGVISGTPGGAPGVYTVNLRVSDSSAGTGTHFQVLPFTLNVGGLPEVSIAAQVAAVAEDEEEKLLFVVTRSAALATDTTVNFSATGSAVTQTGAVVTIPAGATRARIYVNPSADTQVEPDETVVLTLLPGTGYTVGEPASAAGTLVNDDFP